MIGLLCLGVDVIVRVNIMQQNNVAFVFPGQGSPKVGMLAELCTASRSGSDLWRSV